MTPRSSSPIDACANIRMGTALFGKVYRIVLKWYGAPGDEAFRDAIEAWKSGYFDGKYVFDEPIPASCPHARTNQALATTR